MLINKWKEDSLELIWLNYPGLKCPKHPKNTFLPKKLWVSIMWGLINNVERTLLIVLH